MITEEIRIIDKLSRIDTKIQNNLHTSINNTAAIGGRMLTTTAHATFLPKLNPLVSGDISFQKDISAPEVTLESKLNAKIEQSDLLLYETTIITNFWTN